MDLREYIREKRKSKGLTVESLAEKIGVHYSTIYDIESGKGRKGSKKIYIRKCARSFRYKCE